MMAMNVMSNFSTQAKMFAMALDVLAPMKFCASGWALGLGSQVPTELRGDSRRWPNDQRKADRSDSRNHADRGGCEDA
jgi:hypothetical protein